MSRTEDKVRENRLRRMAERQGFLLLKSRARDPRDLTYGGYQITDMQHGGVVAGWGNAERGYALDLDAAEAWLTTEDNSPRPDHDRSAPKLVVIGR
jgi:hypothetical protein